jgi:nitrite reductase/ring-hydroxylating ferredoxin subunit
VAEWHDLGPEDEFPRDGMRAVTVGGKAVLVVRLGDAFYASQERCPHLRAHLSRGRLDDTILTCPGHGSRFDVTTGKNVAWVEGLSGLTRTVAQAVSRPQDLHTYPIEVRSAQVWVLI